MRLTSVFVFLLLLLRTSYLAFFLLVFLGSRDQNVEPAFASFESRFSLLSFFSLVDSASGTHSLEGGRGVA